MGDTDVAAIQAAIEAFVAAYNAGDVERCLEVYSDDWVDMPHETRTLVGRAAKEAMAARFRHIFARFRPRLELDTEEIRVSGDMAFDRGTLVVALEPKAGGVTQELRARFLEVWRREPGGAWKVVRSMDNAAAGGE